MNKLLYIVVLLTICSCSEKLPEIRQDKLYGADTTQKEAELKALQEKENFWTKENIKMQEKQQEETSKQQQANISAAINTNAKVVIDQV